MCTNPKLRGLVDSQFPLRKPEIPAPQQIDNYLLQPLPMKSNALHGQANQGNKYPSSDTARTNPSNRSGPVQVLGI